MDAGQLDAARRICASALSRAREVGDLQDQADFLWHMAELDRRAGHIADAGTHLRESLEFAVQTGDQLRLIDCLDTCGHLCAASGHPADAITLWAAHAARPRTRAWPIGRKTRSAARNPCSKPGTRSDQPGHAQPRNAAPR